MKGITTGSWLALLTIHYSWREHQKTCRKQAAQGMNRVVALVCYEQHLACLERQKPFE